MSAVSLDRGNEHSSKTVIPAEAGTHTGWLHGKF